MAIDGWVMVEIMGHRRRAGRGREETVLGAPMLRLEIPGAEGEPSAVEIYAAQSIFAIQETTEEAVRRARSWYGPMAPALPPRSAEPWDEDERGDVEDQVAELAEDDALNDAEASFDWIVRALQFKLRQVEEDLEAMGRDDDDDISPFRGVLVELAAVAISGIRSIDRRKAAGTLPKRLGDEAAIGSPEDGATT